MDVYWGLQTVSPYQRTSPPYRARMVLPPGEEPRDVWDMLKVGKPYTQHLTFFLAPMGPLSDYIGVLSAPTGFIVSPKLLHILDDTGTDMARHPVILVNEKDQQVISDRYIYCIPPTIAAADRHRSVYTCDETSGACSFIDLRIAPSIEKQAYPLFVLAGYPRMLIHEHLRQRWQAAAIEGWQAYPLDTISDMILVGPRQVEIERRLQHAPANGRLWACLAHTYRTMGHLERAQKAYEQAITLIDYSVSIWQGVGKFCTETGRWQEAKRAYEHELSLTPTPFPSFWSSYSEVLLALHQDDEALTAAQRGIHPHLASGQPWYQLARVLHKKGEHEKAVQALKEAIRYDSFPRNMLYLALGQEMELLGRPNKALDVYKRGIQRIGSDLVLLQAVKRLMENKKGSKGLKLIEGELQEVQEGISNRLMDFAKSFADDEEEEITSPS